MQYVYQFAIISFPQPTYPPLYLLAYHRGNFNLKVLRKADNPSDLLQGYKLSSEVSAFEDHRYNSRDRVKVGSFLVQKKLRPSKVFC